jgi:pyruvate, orthophosphate dikinase
MKTKVKTKHVYTFGKGKVEGDRSMRELLGGKGANLAEMSTIGLPVPAGFTISTEACQFYSTHNSEWPEDLADEIREGIQFIESDMKTGFGDSRIRCSYLYGPGQQFLCRG